MRLVWIYVSSFFWHINVIIAAATVTSSLDTVDDITIASFKVIHPLTSNTQSMGIQLQNTSVYILAQSKLDPLLHIGTAPASMPYRYVVLDQPQQEQDNTDNPPALLIIDQEEFTRDPPTSDSTHDFYNRQQRLLSSSSQQQQQQTHQLPSTFFSTSTFYRDDDDEGQVCHPSNEIPTLHVQTNAEDLQELYANYLEDFAINATVSHITGRDFHHFENVRFQLSGQTSRLFEKLSYSMHIAKEEGGLGGYRKFKLRASVTDPSFIREKLYYDVLGAAGLPASRASYVRLFVNNEPMGLYVMVDNYKNPFLKNIFGGKKKKATLHKKNKYKHGVLYQGEIAENYTNPETPSANLAYRGPLASDYEIVTATTNDMDDATAAAAAAGNSTSSTTALYRIRQESADSKEPPGLTRLIEFLKFIATNSTDEQEWEQRFDVDMFLKNMAFEVLMGHVDGYLGAAHNYFLYYNPTTQKLVWMTADLDQTMGNTMFEVKKKQSQEEQQEVDRYGLLDHNRPLFQQIMQIPTYKKQFNKILKEIHKGLFTDDCLFDHVNYLTELIKEDVAWDANIRTIRSSAFDNDATAQKHRRQIQEKILQLPLGSDLLARINMIDFHSALHGPIVDHPSIMPLHDYITQAKQALTSHVASGTNIAQ